MADLQAAFPFNITVLEGPQQGTTVALEGRALPYQGTAYETEQRVKTTYYPGNPVATQQVMGPVDKPTTINGIWKDKFLGDGRAKMLVDTFDGLCRSGYEVEVSWGQGMLPDGTLLLNPPIGPNWPIVRRGIISNLKHTYERTQDIAWEITFAFRGRDEAAAPPFTAAGLISVQDGFDELKVKFEDSQASVEAFKASPLAQLSGIATDVNAALDEAQNSLANMIGYVDSSSGSVQDLTDIPANMLERGRLLAAQGASALGGLTDSMLRVKRALFNPGDEALALLDAVTSIFDVVHFNDEAQESANNTNEALAKQIRPEVLAELRPVPGTDLRDIARQFYGDPDLWYVIADFNNLSSSRVPSTPDGPSDNQALPIRVPQRPQGFVGATSPSC